MLARRPVLRGLVITAIIGFAGVQTGLIEPTFFTGGTSVTETDYTPSPAEQGLFDFVTVVLADTERVWGDEFQRIGRAYRDPVLAV